MSNLQSICQGIQNCLRFFYLVYLINKQFIQNCIQFIDFNYQILDVQIIFELSNKQVAFLISFNQNTLLIKFCANLSEALNICVLQNFLNETEYFFFSLFNGINVPFDWLSTIYQVIVDTYDRFFYISESLVFFYSILIDYY